MPSCSTGKKWVQRHQVIWDDVFVIANIFRLGENSHRAENRNELRGKEEQYQY